MNVFDERVKCFRLKNEIFFFFAVIYTFVDISLVVFIKNEISLFIFCISPRDLVAFTCKHFAIFCKWKNFTSFRDSRKKKIFVLCVRFKTLKERNSVTDFRD